MHSFEKVEHCTVHRLVLRDMARLDPCVLIQEASQSGVVAPAGNTSLQQQRPQSAGAQVPAFKQHGRPAGMNRPYTAQPLGRKQRCHFSPQAREAAQTLGLQMGSLAQDEATASFGIHAPVAGAAHSTVQPTAEQMVRHDFRLLACMPLTLPCQHMQVAPNSKLGSVADAHMAHSASTILSFLCAMCARLFPHAAHAHPKLVLS